MNKTINRFSVEIQMKNGLISKELGTVYEFKKVEIIGENERLYCLKDDYFSRVQKKPDGKINVHHVVGKESISSHINDNCFGTQLHYTHYSFSKVRKSTIKKQIEAYVQDKFGGFASIDLSCLDN